MADTELIAVIDTETNWYGEIMSIGVVLADSVNFRPVRRDYYIFDEHAAKGGMFSHVLEPENVKVTRHCGRSEGIEEIRNMLRAESVSRLFAYNAKFDLRQLPELCDFDWYDIMGIAAYIQYNTKIPKNADCFSTGRLKKNYGVEAMIHILSGDKSYTETHNAVLDALDELKIMELMELELEIYENTRLEKHNVSKAQAVPQKKCKAPKQTQSKPAWQILFESIRK